MTVVQPKFPMINGCSIFSLRDILVFLPIIVILPAFVQQQNNFPSACIWYPNSVKWVVKRGQYFLWTTFKPSGEVDSNHRPPGPLFPNAALRKPYCILPRKPYYFLFSSHLLEFAILNMIFILSTLCISQQTTHHRSLLMVRWFWAIQKRLFSRTFPTFPFFFPFVLVRQILHNALFLDWNITSNRTCTSVRALYSL